LIRLPQYRVVEVTVDPDHALGWLRMAHGGAEIDSVTDLFLAGEPADAVAAPARGLVGVEGTVIRTAARLSRRPPRGPRSVRSAASLRAILASGDT
jgi:hypothetical protein